MFLHHYICLKLFDMAMHHSLLLLCLHPKITKVVRVRGLYISLNYYKHLQGSSSLCHLLNRSSLANYVLFVSDCHPDFYCLSLRFIQLIGLNKDYRAVYAHYYWSYLLILVLYRCKLLCLFWIQSFFSRLQR